MRSQTKTSRYTQLFLTGYYNGLEGVRKKVDSVPYEKFPYCCSAENTIKKEYDMSRARPIVRKQEEIQVIQEPIRQPYVVKSTPPKAPPVMLRPQNFWSPPLIAKHANIRSSFQIEFINPTPGTQYQSMRTPISSPDFKVKCDNVVQKYEEIRAQLQQEANREYYNSKNSPNEEDRISYDQFQEMLQQINYDVAWQIFDEVNEYNDVEQIVDLNCLDIMDAQAITKQKIYDIGKTLRERNPHFDPNYSQPYALDQVLCITCGENHMVKIEDDHTGKAPLRNAILETIRNELQMDHYYISQTRTILVRINFETLENDILRDNQ